MTEPATQTTPALQPETRSVPKYEFITILIAVVGMGIAISTLLLTTTGRIEARLDSAIARVAAEAAADRRAFQASMDEHRRDMRRLSERQARLEGQREGSAQQ